MAARREARFREELQSGYFQVLYHFFEAWNPASDLLSRFCLVDVGDPTPQVRHSIAHVDMNFEIRRKGLLAELVKTPSSSPSMGSISGSASSRMFARWSEGARSPAG